MIQWRDKTREKGLQLADARAVRALCRQHDALFMVNDHVDLALVTGAEGVHVGQKDLPVAEVRRIAPPGFIVGASTNNAHEARVAEAAGASYIAVGDLFGTASKKGTRAASPARLAAVKAAVGLPVIGIGGINAANVAEVMAAGADGIAVIGAVCAAEDPRSAAAQLVHLIETHDRGG